MRMGHSREGTDSGASSTKKRSKISTAARCPTAAQLPAVAPDGFSAVGVSAPPRPGHRGRAKRHVGDTSFNAHFVVIRRHGVDIFFVDIGVLPSGSRGEFP